MLDLTSTLEYVKGVGPKKVKLLREELNIHKVIDLLNLIPIRYVDKSKFYKINEVDAQNADVQIVGRFTNVQELGAKRSRRLVVKFQDQSGSIELVWFKGIDYIKKKIVPSTDMVVYGKITNFNGKLSINHPDFETLENFKITTKLGLQPVYPSTEKLKNSYLNNKAMTNIMRTVLQSVGEIPETLSEQIKKENKLIDRTKAYQILHFPKDVKSLKYAQLRLKFEELFFQQLSMIVKKMNRKYKYKGTPFTVVGEYFNTFYKNHLPFELTNAQKRVIKEIRKDVGRDVQMNRLLQGDVGAGKTIVAFLIILIALDNGVQTCLMAPTEILAIQHYNGLKEFAELLDLNINILTGSTRTKKRREIHQELEEGTLNILVGTHALLEDKVKFKNLGLSIIDEQHRFGVAQRAKMWKKNTIPPHMLVMTATPIPRTLAMTSYGDLDISIIDELPAGRKAIKTVHYKDNSRLKVFGFMRKEIAKGRQVYIVYPLIQESESMDYKDLQDGYESIAREFPMPDYQISIVHGQMKPADKEFEMNRFIKGETQIMVATTVIEVGVNVPNASVMVIESSERFGLSQLHQLRGRVGRGAEQSYCVLMSGDKLSTEGKTRLKTMCETNDGFRVAEVDLELRGPGDVMGTKQSGELNLKIADIIHDKEILSRARDVAIETLEKDHQLSLPENKNIREEYLQNYLQKTKWSRIS